jgi:hypothetical protein
MVELLPDTREIAPGAHAIEFYATPSEAARNMARFLRGADDFHQPAIVLTADDAQLARYRAAAAEIAPAMAGSFRRIPGLHTYSTRDGRRPDPSAMQFAAEHPGGASLCGDTISSDLNDRNVGEYLAYEAWFDQLRPFPHRALCPYDLTRIPIDRASEALRELTRHHTHAVLSDDPNPGVQLLQLLLVPLLDRPPAPQRVYLDRAIAERLVERRGRDDVVGLTLRGEQLVRALVGLRL